MLIDNIGTLVTNDPELGTIDERRDRLRRRRRAVGRAEHSTRRKPPGTERFDAQGRAVIPGFVDSHGHLVFAGDRAHEFAARMAGEPYEAGGIRTTVEATRNATDDQLGANMDRLIAEALRSGTTTVETKSGYGLTVPDERRSLTIATPRTDERTFLGAHVVPPEHDADAYVELVKGEMLDACAPHARWIDVFCERGAFDGDQTREILAAGIAKGLTPRVHANQLGHGPGVQIAVELGAASADHVTHTTDDDVDALANSDTVATLLPGAEFSTRARVPRRAPADRRRRHRRARRRLQPRHELHDQHPVLHRARRARDGHDPGRGGRGRDARRREGAPADRHRPPRRRRAGRRRPARRAHPHPPRLPSGRAARRGRVAARALDLQPALGLGSQHGQADDNTRRPRR